MYVCICNAITEKDIKEKPELNNLVGTVCGMCINNEPEQNNKQIIKKSKLEWVSI
tara:strand:- start:658 stop:822 length:165 start_codon:yes stop_codon:yes gene_type:complete